MSQRSTKQVKTLNSLSKENIKNKNNKPVISESVLDADSQRYYVWALFMLIQAWKFYDLYILHNGSSIDLSNSNSSNWLTIFNFLPPKLLFIFKYLFLDSLLILIIPFLNIPKLLFTPSICLISLFIINFSTILLACNFSFTISSIIYSVYRIIIPEKELAIMETYVDTDSIINQSDHFKGKKTLRYAPDSSIKINPFNQQFCIRPIYNDLIKIPIRVESTYDLNYIQINYHDFNNQNTILNYTQKEIKSFIVGDYYNSPYIKYDPSVLADNNVQIIEIPIDKPGYYSIKLATDKKDKMIRSFRSDTIIPVCPEAAFVTKPFFNVDKCIDDTVNDLEITLLGVPPFTLYYEEEINGKLSKLPPTVVSHVEKIDSPLNSKDFSKNNKNIKYDSNYLRDISWAKSYNITIPVGEKKLENSGNYIYTINKIMDGFGNSVSYTPDPNDESTFSSFISHPKPVLSLIDPKPLKPILIDDEKYLNVKLSNIDCIDCEAPFDVVFKYLPNGNDYTENKEEIFSHSFIPNSGSDFRIKVDKPGTYMIEQGSSKYCSCKLGPSSLNILSAKLPKMEVLLNPIVDNCVGTTGFKFNFDFSGNAPFEIGYKFSKLDPNNSNRVLQVKKTGSIKSASTTLEYDFNPPSEGSYSIEFITLSDKFYKNKICYNQGEYRYVTYFKQRPKAYFDKSQKVQTIKCCHGASSNVILHIEGKAPYNIAYDLISPDYSVQSFTLENIYEDQIHITTPEFHKGGEYILSLKSVKDSTDCDVEFKGQEVHIDVKNDVPQLSFPKSETFQIVEGKSFSVPLKIQSNDLIDLVYSYESFDGQINKKISLNRFNPMKGLQLSKEGIYKLVFFKQGECVGKIINNYEVKINYIPVPTLNVVQNGDNQLTQLSDSVFQKSKICQNKNAHIDLQAKGSTPFIIKYEVKHPDGRIEEKLEQINNINFTLQLVSNTPGLYTYTIKDIFDSVYSEEILSNLKRSNDYKYNKLIFNHEVAPLPTAKFLDHDRIYQTCISLISDLTKIQPINVQLDGTLPITLKVDIYHEYDGVLETVEFKNLVSEIVDLNSIYQYMGIGTHVISISEVSDANGCISDENKLQEETITIQVNDVPKIRHLIEESNQLSDFDFDGSSYYCVGDHITYMLNGIPPFTINYEFNSVSQKVEIQGNYFKRRAPGPGKLSIISLSDSSSKECMVDFTDLNRSDLNAIIYDLPSVEIAQGESIEEDIHEGEQIEITFLLTGTPPFKLTYIRKELDDSSKIVETEIVENIMTNEYRVMANLEGTYEAIEIQDRYCVARNRRI